jgi:tetrahydrodipicolinate N-succinyltransferase
MTLGAASDGTGVGVGEGAAVAAGAAVTAAGGVARAGVGDGFSPEEQASAKTVARATMARTGAWARAVNIMF